MDALFAAPIGALLIFLLRIIDVSLATMRMMVSVRGRRGLAAMIGFVEVLVWLLAAGHALQHLDSWMHIMGYAGGFATGSYVGVWIGSHISRGLNVIRAVHNTVQRPDGRTQAQVVARMLRGKGYGVTEIIGKGLRNNVEILNIVVPSQEVPGVLKILHTEDPDAFVSVEEVRTVMGGYIRPGGRKSPFIMR